MDRLRGQEGEGILVSRLPLVPGQLRKVPKPTTQKGAKMPKNQILVVAQLARLPQPSRWAPERQETTPTSSDRSCFNLPKAVTFHHKLIISLLTMWPHSHDASSTASTISGPASPDGYKRWPLSPLCTSLPSHSITSNQNKDRFS